MRHKTVLTRFSDHFIGKRKPVNIRHLHGNVDVGLHDKGEHLRGETVRLEPRSVGENGISLRLDYCNLSRGVSCSESHNRFPFNIRLICSHVKPVDIISSEAGVGRA